MEAHEATLMFGIIAKAVLNFELVTTIKLAMTCTVFGVFIITMPIGMKTQLSTPIIARPQASYDCMQE